VGGIFLGALSANRLAGKISIPRQISIGYVLLIGASLANVLYHAVFPPAVPWSVIPLFFYTFGMSMAAPGITLLILDLFPNIRGIVASCQSFTQTMLGAAVSGLIAPLLSHSVLWLAGGQLVFALIGLGLWQAGHAYHKAQAQLQSQEKINAWETVE